jgi:hypothetical protein
VLEGSIEDVKAAYLASLLNRKMVQNGLELAAKIKREIGRARTSCRGQSRSSTTTAGTRRSYAGEGDDAHVAVIPVLESQPTSWKSKS